MSEHENYNHEEHSSQDGVYSYSYRDINQGDPVGDATGSAGYQSSSANQSGTGSQQTEHYEWNPYQETKKKGFLRGDGRIGKARRHPAEERNRLLSL